MTTTEEQVILEVDDIAHTGLETQALESTQVGRRKNKARQIGRYKGPTICGQRSNVGVPLT